MADASVNMDGIVSSPKQVPRPRRALFWAIFLGGGALMLAAAVVLPCAVPARTTAEKNACICNLRSLDGAKEQWALETKATNGTMMTFANITEGDHPYLRGVLKCPAGGVYLLGLYGENPRCTFADKGHRLN